MIFAFESLAYDEFDERINKINYPEFYKAGLFYTLEEDKQIETQD